MRIALITTQLGRPSVGGMMNIPLKVFILILSYHYINIILYFLLLVKKINQLFKKFFRQLQLLL